MLTDDQAEAYAKSIKQVSDCYDKTMDPKLIAWVQLLGTAGAIYGPAFLAIRARQSEEAKKGPKVVVMPDKNKTVPGPGDNSAAPVTPADIYGLGYSAAIPDRV
jgi:hypothetical protein